MFITYPFSMNPMIYPLSLEAFITGIDNQRCEEILSASGGEQQQLCLMRAPTRVRVLPKSHVESLT